MKKAVLREFLKNRNKVKEVVEEPKPKKTKKK
jgi:hypothetical protein